MHETKKISNSELIDKYEQEAEASLIDSTTSLFNHGFFRISLEREIKRSQRYGFSFILSLRDVKTRNVNFR